MATHGPTVAPYLAKILARVRLQKTKERSMRFDLPIHVKRVTPLSWEAAEQHVTEEHRAAWDFARESLCYPEHFLPIGFTF